MSGDECQETTSTLSRSLSLPSACFPFDSRLLTSAPHTHSTPVVRVLATLLRVGVALWESLRTSCCSWCAAHIGLVDSQRLLLVLLA